MSSAFRRVATALALLAAVSSCQLLKKKGADDAGESDAGSATAEQPAEDAAAAAPAAPTPVAAANENDIARFPDEAKLDGAAAPLMRWATVREAPVFGGSVASLKAGTTVSKISQRDKYVLVTFDDPKDASRKLMGWLHQDSFNAAPATDAGIKPLTCTAPEIALFSDGAFCGRVCAADAECPAEQACKGSAQKLANGKVGEAVKVCTFYAHPHPTTPGADAGTKPPTTDAGAPPPVIADAGGGKLGAIDSGAPAPTPPPVKAGGDIVDPPCSGDFVLVSADKKCHRKCPSGIAPKDCKAEGKFCGVCDGQKVCQAVRGQCK